MGYYMAGGWLDDLGSFLSGSANKMLGPVTGPIANAVANSVSSKKSSVKSVGRALSGAIGGRHHRHMHVTNVKALRRAMRRVQGFAHLAKSTINFTHHVKMKHHRKRR